MEPRRRALTATDVNQPPRALPYDPTYPRKPLPNAPKKRTSTEAGLELPPIRNLDRPANNTPVLLPSVSGLPSIRPNPPVPGTAPTPPVSQPRAEAPLSEQPQQQKPAGPKRGQQNKFTPSNPASNPASIQFVLSTGGGDPPQASRTAAGGAPSSGSKSRSSLMSVPPILDVSAISLVGEDTSSVPVYDTCDTVRTKIKRILARDGVTQAAFLREIGKTYPEPRKIQSKSLNDFLAKKGPSAGNTSCIYYAGYVFFEKVRIRDGKPKTTDRLEMERLWPDGCNTTDIRSRVYVQAGEKAYEDKYGRLHIVGK